MRSPQKLARLELTSIFGIGSALWQHASSHECHCFCTNSPRKTRPTTCARNSTMIRNSTMCAVSANASIASSSSNSSSLSSPIHSSWKTTKSMSPMNPSVVNSENSAVMIGFIVSLVFSYSTSLAVSNPTLKMMIPLAITARHSNFCALTSSPPPMAGGASKDRTEPTPKPT